MYMYSLPSAVCDRRAMGLPPTARRLGMPPVHIKGYYYYYYYYHYYYYYYYYHYYYNYY